MQKTEQALARSRRASRRETGARASETTRVEQPDTQHSDVVEPVGAVEGIEPVESTVEVVGAVEPVVESTVEPVEPVEVVEVVATSQESAQDVQSSDVTQNTSEEKNIPSAVVSVQTAQDALARAREAEQRARDLANDARKAAQQAQRDFDRIKLDAEQAALAAKRAQYKIEYVNVSPLDAMPELRQAILGGGMIAVRAFQTAVEAGVLTVRARKKARVVREASATPTTPTTPTTPRAPGRVLTAEEITDIVQRAQAGEKAADIGKVHGLHHVTVSAILSGRISAK